MHAAHLTAEPRQDLEPSRFEARPLASARRHDRAWPWSRSVAAGATGDRFGSRPGVIIPTDTVESIAAYGAGAYIQETEPGRCTWDGTLDVDSDLVIRARAAAPVRRAMAALAARFVALRGWERLGFARLRDYATERLGLSARSLHDLAHTHAALATLPLITAAFGRGEITWTKARLLARVARPADEQAWLAHAQQVTASALSREVRRVDAESLERASPPTKNEDADNDRGENVVIPCTPQVQAKWYRARQLAWRVAGHPVRPWECGEMVAAEVLSAIPIDSDDVAGVRGVPSVSTAGDYLESLKAAGRGVEGDTANLSAERPDAPPRSEQKPASNGRSAAAPQSAEPLRAEAAVGEAAASPLPPELPPFLKPLLTDLSTADEFELDRRLRRVVKLEQSIDGEVGSLLLLAAHGRRYRSQGAGSLEEYARERLGISPRKARALLRLERASQNCPTLARAYREGRLSWVQAHSLIPVLRIPYGYPRNSAWIDWARQVSVRRLRHDIDHALLLNETDPEAFAATGGLPPAAPESSMQKRQTGAHPTSGQRDTSRPSNTFLFFHAPRDVARLFRAVLATVRRSIEKQTGRMPTAGEAFDAMLDHVFDTWGTLDAPSRAAHRVFARDGWRCTVPGCSSYSNLHDHHIVFRSAGGSNDLSNRTTLCAWHHLRGVHARTVRCTGGAPDDIRFELGLRELAGPLVVFGPGERLAGDQREHGH